MGKSLVYKFIHFHYFRSFLARRNLIGLDGWKPLLRERLIIRKKRFTRNGIVLKSRLVYILHYLVCAAGVMQLFFFEKAIHPYVATQPDELSLEVADVVNVLRKMADGNVF